MPSPWGLTTYEVAGTHCGLPWCPSVAPRVELRSLGWCSVMICRSSSNFNRTLCFLSGKMIFRLQQHHRWVRGGRLNSEPGGLRIKAPVGLQPGQALHTEQDPTQRLLTPNPPSRAHRMKCHAKRSPGALWVNKRGMCACCHRQPHGVTGKGSSGLWGPWCCHQRCATLDLFVPLHNVSPDARGGRLGGCFHSALWRGLGTLS